jgi:hypothetical protein
MSALPRNTTIALLLVVTVCALLVLADVTRADPTKYVVAFLFTLNYEIIKFKCKNLKSN